MEHGPDDLPRLEYGQSQPPEGPPPGTVMVSQWAMVLIVVVTVVTASAGAWGQLDDGFGTALGAALFCGVFAYSLAMMVYTAWHSPLRAVLVAALALVSILSLFRQCTM